MDNNLIRNLQIEKNKNRDLVTASENAARELGISFALYESTDQIYNSKDIYNRIGLFDKKLNPQASSKKFSKNLNLIQNQVY